jgi:hypothetical protein
LPYGSTSREIAKIYSSEKRFFTLQPSLGQGKAKTIRWYFFRGVGTSALDKGNANEVKAHDTVKYLIDGLIKDGVSPRKIPWGGAK